MNHRIQYATTIISMFFIIIAALLTSFQITIYGDSDYSFYEKEYIKYDVASDMDMTIDNVMEVTTYMMDYLIGREDVLSIETEVDGQTQDFFNEQDRLHMADVRNLFLGGLSLRNVLLVIAVILLVILAVKKAELQTLLLKAYICAAGIFALLLAFLGVAFSIDFTKCFIIFHKMFFTNDLWMFDPATDYMIRMLPEGFFYDMVIRIVIVFVCFLVGGLLVVLGVKRSNQFQRIFRK